jgi:uncharacterized protein YndB with AHSA1/START domain
MSTPTAPSHLTFERTYRASPERVYRAWTDPDELALWFAPDPTMTIQAELDLREGGRYRVAMGPHVVAGVFREIVPQRKLVFTWQWQTEAGAAETLVTVEVEPADDGGTRVRLRHDRFPDEQERTNHEQGWTAILARLAERLARQD